MLDLCVDGYRIVSCSNQNLFIACNCKVIEENKCQSYTAHNMIINIISKAHFILFVGNNMQDACFDHDYVIIISRPFCAVFKTHVYCTYYQMYIKPVCRTQFIEENGVKFII
jgi:hypothetical protein